MKLLAVDFSNLIIRQASNPYAARIVDLAGNPMGGAVGSLRQVLRTVEKERPTHLLVARDGARDESIRRDIDPAYKAHRPDADDDLKRQFAAAYQGCEILGLPVLGFPRYEADDVIASAAAKFPGDVTVLTGDRDLLALVSPRVEVVLLKPGGQRRCVSDRDVIDVIHVRANQVRDFKSLCGDASDGIKGIKGIGKVGALALLKDCGTLAECYRRLDADEPIADVKPALLKKLAEGRADARIAWRLVGLIQTLDVPLDSLLRRPIPDDAEMQLGDAGLAWLWAELDAERARQNA